LREILPDGLDGERLDRVVCMLVGCSRSEANAMIEGGAVVVDGEVAPSRSVKLRAGQVLDIDVPAPSAAPAVEADASVDLAVVHADEHVVVVDKPAGLVVHPGSGNALGTLVHGAVARWPEMAEVGDPMRPGVVHRIDQGTSGLLVLARSSVAYDALVAQFSSRVVEREYLALAWGHVEPSQGMIDAPIGRSQRDPTRMTVSNQGREARTRYEVLQQFVVPAAITYLSCRLETGRTHQIRVHLAAIGHPLVGDGRYGGDRPAIDLDRPWLHAARLGFEHPATGEHLSFSSELPTDLAEILSHLS
jgi:23S rRNA pseudouridine1911/1915/1917 synthase